VLLGTIYAYVDPNSGRPVYVGSTNNLVRRHHCHLKAKTRIAKWLRSFENPPFPREIENFFYEDVQELYERENFFIDFLCTRVKLGGLNRDPAGGCDRAAAGRIGGKNASHEDKVLSGKASIPFTTYETRAKGGHITATTSKSFDEARRKVLIKAHQDKEHQRKASLAGNHKRFHLNKGIKNPNCKLCQEIS
jgi:hypothetical protein